jgi:hypothetical protein
VLVLEGASFADTGYSTHMDASGRWLATYVDAAEAGLESEIAVAPLDVPDPAATLRLTTSTEDSNPGSIMFTADGEGLFYVEHLTGQTGSKLWHVDLRDEVPATPNLVDEPLAPNGHIGYVYPSGLGGMLYNITQMGPGNPTSVWFTHVEDGVATEPELLLSGLSGPVGDVLRSPDERWLAFRQDIGGTEHIYLVDTGDGSSATLHELELELPGPVLFAPDSQSVVVQHREGGVGALSRVALVDDVPGLPELLATDVDDFEVGNPADLTADNTMLVTNGMALGEYVVLAIDISGALPAVPVQLSAAAPPGTWGQFAELCSDSRHVAYIERTGIFAPERLMLADLQDPGSATIVLDAVVGWSDVSALE